MLTDILNLFVSLLTSIVTLDVFKYLTCFVLFFGLISIAKGLLTR